MYVPAGGVDSYIDDGFATLFTQINGAYRWFQAPSGTAGNAISFTQAMTLDASGNLGVGITSPVARVDAVAPLVAFRGSVTEGGILYRQTSSSTSSGITELHMRANAGKSTYITFTEDAVADRWSVGTQNGNGALRFISGTPAGGTERMRLDSSGNLGLGVTPSAWRSDNKALQMAWGSVFDNGGAIGLIGNAFYNTSSQFIYRSTAAAALYETYGGVHAWYTAPSGTAGNAISFTQSMTLQASGGLSLGTTNDAGAGNINLANGKFIGWGGLDTLIYGDSASNFIYFRTNGAEKARIDSSGNFGIGTTSPSFVSGYGGLQINGASNGSVLHLTNSTTGTTATDGFDLILLQGGSDAYVWQRENAALIFGTNSTERARIDSSGNLLINATAALTSADNRLSVSGVRGIEARSTGGATAATQTLWNNATSDDNVFVSFRTETSDTQRGTISYNRTAGLVAYNTTSDYRAKDIYGPVTDSGALIDSTPVYMGKMKGATQERPMFIAHEVPAYAHTGVKDAVDADGKPVYQQMDASALIPVMWAEIQSLRARLAAANI
jgi:hypothetical protein